MHSQIVTAATLHRSAKLAYAPSEFKCTTCNYLCKHSIQLSCCKTNVYRSCLVPEPFVNAIQCPSCCVFLGPQNLTCNAKLDAKIEQWKIDNEIELYSKEIVFRLKRPPPPPRKNVAPLSPSIDTTVALVSDLNLNSSIIKDISNQWFSIML